MMPLVRVRHKKRGTFYHVLGPGTLQTDKPLEDNAPLVIYRSDPGGRLRARAEAEFYDGRFEPSPLEGTTMKNFAEKLDDLIDAHFENADGTIKELYDEVVSAIELKLMALKEDPPDGAEE